MVLIPADREKTSLKEIEYKLSLKLNPNGWRQHWHGLVITAPIVGTNGIVYDEECSNLFGQIRVLRNSVRLAWFNNHILPIESYGNLNHGYSHRIEIAIPKNPIQRFESVRKAILKISTRLGFVLCPQNPHLFRGKPTRDFCMDVHHLVCVHEVTSA